MGWWWRTGIRLGLQETRGAQIPGPTDFSPDHGTAVVPSVSVGQGEGGDGPAAEYKERGERRG